MATLVDAIQVLVGEPVSSQHRHSRLVSCSEMEEEITLGVGTELVTSAGTPLAVCETTFRGGTPSALVP